MFLNRQCLHKIVGRRFQKNVRYRQRGLSYPLLARSKFCDSFAFYFVRISAHTQTNFARPWGVSGFRGPVSTEMQVYDANCSKLKFILELFLK